MKAEKNEIVILNKQNTLIKAKYNLNASELKMYLFVLQRIQIEYICKANRESLLIETKGVTLKTPRSIFYKIVNKQYGEHRRIEKVLDSLQTKPVYYEIKNDKGKKKWEKFCFVTYQVYDEEKDEYEITIPATIFDMLVNYKESGYTPLNLAMMFSLKGIYAYRMYELLRMWSNTKSIINYTVQELKEFLMLDNKKSYNTYANFKNKVILPAINELNDLNIFEISIKEIKQGQKVVAIDFIVKDLDKRVYYNDPNIIEIYDKKVNVGVQDNKHVESKAVDKSIKDFYIPNKKLFTAKTLSNFINDFIEYDFKNSIMKQALQESILATLEKDDEEKIKSKAYKYFKTTLKDKLSKSSNTKGRNNKTLTKFHNINQTFSKYSEEELENILKNQQDKHGNVSQSLYESAINGSWEELSNHSKKKVLEYAKNNDKFIPGDWKAS